LFFQDDLDLWFSRMVVGGNTQQLVKAKQEHTHHQKDACPSLSALCPRECVTCALPGRTRTTIIKALTELAEKSGYLYNPNDFLNEITKREEAGSTNLGNGIAIPHTMTREVGFFEQTFVCIAKLATPSFFNAAPDGTPTEILILSCSADSSEHLNILNKISSLCRCTSFIEDVREATTDEEIYQALLNAESALANPSKKKHVR
ncbi:MAG: PTS sugar transporter subunit IIA, partial [Victivallales bacterium]|nr:PTS sugar transporter subunit IIA [Victivallales bacterium]